MAYQPNYYANPYGMYPGMSQTMQTQPQVQAPVNVPQTQVRTVYSEAEARSAQIPIDGSTVVFTDAQNGRIYTKRFDYTNGSFPFETYQRVAEQTPQTAPEYVTLSQFESRIAEIEAMIPKKVVSRNDPPK